MTNNEIFKRLLHLTGCSKDKENLIYIFKLGGVNVNHSRIKRWRTDLDKSNSMHMSDEALRGFITGLFEYRDQMREKGVNVFNFPGNDL